MGSSLGVHRGEEAISQRSTGPSQRPVRAALRILHPHSTIPHSLQVLHGVPAQLRGVLRERRQGRVGAVQPHPQPREAEAGDQPGAMAEGQPVVRDVAGASIHRRLRPQVLRQVREHILHGSERRLLHRRALPAHGAGHLAPHQTSQQDHHVHRFQPQRRPPVSVGAAHDHGGPHEVDYRIRPQLYIQRPGYAHLLHVCQEVQPRLPGAPPGSGIPCFWHSLNPSPLTRLTWRSLIGERACPLPI